MSREAGTIERRLSRPAGSARSGSETPMFQAVPTLRRHTDVQIDSLERTILGTDRPNRVVQRFTTANCFQRTPQLASIRLNTPRPHPIPTLNSEIIEIRRFPPRCRHRMQPFHGTLRVTIRGLIPRLFLALERRLFLRIRSPPRPSSP